MKKIVFLALFISAVMMLLPLAVLGEELDTKDTGRIMTVSKKQPKTEKNGEVVFRVYDKENDKVIELKAEDYIFGVVAAEMPAAYETEALKAQAVAAFTYACYKKAQNRNKEYDITTDYTVDQSYISLEKAKERWGEKADEYVKKIKDAVDSTKYLVLSYDSAPILAVYHAVSSGKTYSAKEVWGKELLYLQPVLSDGDKLAPNYLSTITFQESELKSKLCAALNIKATDDDLLNNRVSGKSGIVTCVSVFGKEVSGSSLRSALDLPSSNYKFEKDGNTYVFKCYGYGHGVGMSQNGANYMAKQGYTYKEILNHYYTDCKLEKYKG